MAYSTTAEFRRNCPYITTNAYSDVNLALRIADADKDVEIDLSKYIDPSLIVTTPDFINKLSQYRTAVLVLASVYGNNRNQKDNGDIGFFQAMYDKLLEDVRMNNVILEDGDGTSIARTSAVFTRDSMVGSEPKFGTGKYGEYVTDAENAEEFEQTD